MKKILLTTIAAGCGLAAFGQGGVLLENANNSSAHWNLNTSSGPTAPLGTDVQLLWYNGTSFVNVGSVYTTTSAHGDTAQAGFGLYFYGSPQAVSIPTYSSTGTFEVEGWTGGYASYAAAVSAGAYIGETASFTAAEANLATTPAGTSVSITEATGQDVAGKWNGDLTLVEVAVPEPSTIALGGLGAAALLLFRRKK